MDPLVIAIFLICVLLVWAVRGLTAPGALIATVVICVVGAVMIALESGLLRGAH